MRTKRFRANSRLGILVLLMFLLLGGTALSATFYVSPGGGRTSGASTLDDWSKGNCYGTIRAAIDAMGSGDEVVIDDGEYRDHSVNSIRGVPGGVDAQNYTKVRARNPYEVFIISNEDVSQAAGDHPVYLGQDYIWVDGIVVHHRDATNAASFQLAGDYGKVTRSISIRFGDAGDYPAGFSLSGNYNLVEDCAAAGNTRYLFRTGGTDSTSHHNVFRRCVARADFTTTEEPKANFATYGNNAGNGEVNHHAFQNCIAIDSQNLFRDGEAIFKSNGSWYIFKGVDAISLDGSISLNQANTGDSSVYIGGENGSNQTVKNSVFWDGVEELKFAAESVTVSNMTFGDSYRINFASGSNVINNSFMANNRSSDLNSVSSASYNAFYSADNFGASQISETALPKYLPRVDSALRSGTGLSGADVGANILYRIGTSGSLYGESGWDAETADLLWPWPYEDKIQREFRRSNPPPSVALVQPATNDTMRGFCATGQTLTKYIWEYLGNSIGDPNTFDYVAGYIPGTQPPQPVVVEPASNLRIN